MFFIEEVEIKSNVSKENTNDFFGIALQSSWTMLLEYLIGTKYLHQGGLFVMSNMSQGINAIEIAHGIILPHSCSHGPIILQMDIFSLALFLFFPPLILSDTFPSLCL